MISIPNVCICFIHIIYETAYHEHREVWSVAGHSKDRRLQVAFMSSEINKRDHL